ncbi:MAG: DUF3014 domain-containing protein [Stagnimonas sp.]|nr:DUF3014 domain-containing protein [Stagnimonas sp.]
MNEKQWFAALLAITLAVAGGVYWFWLRQPEPEAVAVAAPVAAAASTEPAAPAAPEYPVPALPAAESEPPLPALADSDGELLERLRGLLGAPGVEAVLVPEQLIRRLVVAVDNLPRERVGLRDWPVRRTAGVLTVQEEPVLLPGGYSLRRDNGARYGLAVALVKAADAPALVRLYFRYYPLFNQAYRELGYPQGHFNDRLVTVIDHLLAAPTPPEPVLLVRPKVMYEFADPALEALSFGQKLMIRLGTENRAVVAGKLREIRALVVQGPASSD